MKSRRQTHVWAVNIFSRHDHLDVDAPRRGSHETLADLTVRNEVGVLDPDSLSRRLNCHVVEELGHRALVISRAPDGLRENLSRWLDGGELLEAVEDLSRRMHPILEKDVLQLGNDRP